MDCRPDCQRPGSRPGSPGPILTAGRSNGKKPPVIREFKAYACSARLAAARALFSLTRNLTMRAISP